MLIIFYTTISNVNRHRKKHVLTWVTEYDYVKAI